MMAFVPHPAGIRFALCAALVVAGFAPAPARAQAADERPAKARFVSLHVDFGALIFGGVQDPAAGDPGASAGTSLSLLQFTEVGVNAGWRATDNALFAARHGVAFGGGPAGTFSPSIIEVEVLYTGVFEGRPRSENRFVAGGVRYEVGLGLSDTIGTPFAPAPSFIFGLGPTVWLGEVVRVALLYRAESPSTLAGGKAGFAVKLSFCP